MTHTFQTDATRIQGKASVSLIVGYGELPNGNLGVLRAPLTGTGSGYIRDYVTAVPGLYRIFDRDGVVFRALAADGAIRAVSNDEAIEIARAL